MTAEYDPELLITAGELREAGIDVAEHIPDCGWTSRASLEFGEATHDEPTAEEREARIIPNMRIAVTTGPFQWIETKGTLTTEVAQAGGNENG